MLQRTLISTFFFFNDTATTEIYTLSLHDALPISPRTTTKVPAPECVQKAEARLNQSLTKIAASFSTEFSTAVLKSYVGPYAKLQCRRKIRQKNVKAAFQGRLPFSS